MWWCWLAGYIHTEVMDAPAPSIKNPIAAANAANAANAKADNVDTIPAPIAHKRKPFNRNNVNATQWTPYTQVSTGQARYDTVQTFPDDRSSLSPSVLPVSQIRAVPCPHPQDYRRSFHRSGATKWSSLCRLHHFLTDRLFY